MRRSTPPSRFGNYRKTKSQILKEKILFLGGSIIIFSLVAVVAISINNSTPVEAGLSQGSTNKNAQLGSEPQFGSVVLIAPSSPVKQGAKLGSSMLREIYWDRDKVPEGAVRNVNDVVGLYAKVSLPAGVPVVRANLQSNAPSYGIQNLLPEGYRAVTISVDSTSGVEGWATPGAHVDVYLTYRDSRDGLYKTKVAVEDAIVISYNGSTSTGDAFGTSSRSRTVSNKATVTLSVTFKASLKIQTAKAIGKLTLALRNSSDVGSRGDMEFVEDDFTTKSKKAKTSSVKSYAPSIKTKGYVRFKSEDGSEQQLILDDSDRWHSESEY